MKLIRCWVLAIVACSIFGCGREKAGPDTDTIVPTQDQTSSDAAVAQKKCGEYSTLVNLNGTDQCIDIYTQNTCLLRSNGFQESLTEKSGELFDSCLIFENRNKRNDHLWSPSLQIQFGIDNQALKAEFAKWADLNRDKLSYLTTWQSPSNFGEMYYIGGSLSKEAGLGVLNSIQLPFERVDYINLFPAPKYFARVSDLAEYFSDSKAKNTIEKVDLLSNAVKNLYSFYKSVDLADYESTQSLTIKECEDSCVRISKKYKLDDGFVQVRTYIIGNIEYRKELISSDAHGAIKGVLYLVGNQISLIVDIDRNELGHPERFKLYNRLSEIVLERTYEGISLNVLDQERSEFSNRKPKEISIGVCEDNISPESMKKAGFWDHIQIGPNTDFSYYGWQNKLSSPVDYFQGRKYLNNWQLPYSYHDWGSHAVEVIGTILKSREKKSEEIGILPLGAEFCLLKEKADKWFETVANESGMRVVNYSISNEMDQSKCEDESRQIPIFQNTDRFLSVMAAGNRGVDHAVSCPQYSHGQENVIIVGAKPGSGGIQEGNYGDFVDLYADGYSSVSKSWGTSFAAPRVARVAAEIFAMDQGLRPVEVKAILISTADANREFNGDKAIELAKAYVKHNGEVKEAFAEAYPCSWSNWSCSANEAKARSKTFEKILQGEK